MELWSRTYPDRPAPYQKFIIVFSLIVFLGLSTGYIIFSRINKISSDIMKQPMNILLIGVDEKNTNENGELERPRTDTMLFVALHPGKRKVGVFSIPRDSLLDIPGYGRDRINMAHVYGGYELTQEMVEEVMGQPVHGYAMINFKGFEELVDLVGGVEITVDKRMFYVDESAGLKIDLHPGTQVLSGKDSLGFVRFRQDKLGDITRVGRQRQFLMELAKKLMNKRIFYKAPALLRIGFKYLKTDLSFSEFVGMYRLSRRLDLSEDLITSTLPGEFNGPYWSLDKEKIRQMMEEFYQ